MSNKPRFGFLSNVNYIEIKKVKILWIYYSDKILEENEINISIRNQNITLKKVGDTLIYILKSPSYGYNLFNQMFIYEKDNLSAIGKLSQYT